MTAGVRMYSVSSEGDRRRLQRSYSGILMDDFRESEKISINAGPIRRGNTYIQILETLSIALLMLVPSELLLHQSQLLASTEVPRGFQHLTVSVLFELLMLHSAAVVWEAYLELLIQGTEGSLASHRIGIDGDETLKLHLGKFSKIHNTPYHCTLGWSWKQLRMGLGLVDIRRQKVPLKWIH